MNLLCNCCLKCTLWKYKQKELLLQHGYYEVHEIIKMKDFKTWDDIFENWHVIHKQKPYLGESKFEMNHPKNKHQSHDKRWQILNDLNILLMSNPLVETNWLFSMLVPKVV